MKRDKDLGVTFFKRKDFESEEITENESLVLCIHEYLQKNKKRYNIFKGSWKLETIDVAYSHGL